MSERPGEPEPTHPYLAKPVSPSGEAPPPPSEPPTTPYPQQGPAQQPYGQQPYGQQPYGGVPAGPSPYQPYAPGGYPYGFQQSHSGANTAMGLGITSVVCAVLTFVICITLPGVLCGPFAIALALRAQKEMKASPGRYNNESAATTGLVTGIIGTVVGLGVIAIVVVYAGFIVSIFSFGTS